MKKEVVVIGAGLAGCEAALQLANRDIKVKLYEQKPNIKSKAHTLDGFAELVCSNSLKSIDKYTASGLLKEELAALGSYLIKAAYECSIPAGSALAVDRIKYSNVVTELIKTNHNIDVITQQVTSLDFSSPVIIATGPLTAGLLYREIKNLCGEYLNFFDAVSPIISKDSIDMSKAILADRYDKTYGGSSASYINCIVNKEEYEEFYGNLIAAKRVIEKEWEDIKYFESCMPIEIIAQKGKDTMRFGPMRPVGIVDNGKRPYAVLQLRQENTSADMYNIVGFQTALQWSEQKRVFSIIPALKKAEYLRYGVMHRNSYINAPSCIDQFFRLTKQSNIYIAGQLSGVEGYVESIMSGLIAAINCSNIIYSKKLIEFDNSTMCGALINYLTTKNDRFAPMNANFGLLPHIEIKNKDERKIAYYDRSMQSINQIQKYI